MNVVIVGSSGMVGRGVLLECLDSPVVNKILMLNRRHIGLDHPKLTELIVEDFFNLQDQKPDLKDYDACFFCAGTTSVGKTEEEYSRLTLDLTTHFAEAFISESPGSVFCLVTGTGTDSTERGRIMWARIKGKTENAILKMGFKSAYMFRPGYIQPLRGIKSKTKLYAAMYTIFSPLYWLILKHIPGSATSTSILGRAMINAVNQQPEIRILNNREINKLGNE